jgi:hypothetical protein
MSSWVGIGVAAIVVFMVTVAIGPFTLPTRSNRPTRSTQLLPILLPSYVKEKRGNGPFCGKLASYDEQGLKKEILVGKYRSEFRGILGPQRYRIVNASIRTMEVSPWLKTPLPRTHTRIY